jgi:hypothetical protein
VNYIAHAVADENDVNAGFVNDPSGRIIVGCQANKLFAFLLGGSECGNIDLFGFVGF